MNHIENEKKFQSGNKLLSVVDYPHGNKPPDIWIVSQDDGNAIDFELDSIEQLQALIQHLVALEARWPTPVKPQ